MFPDKTSIDQIHYFHVHEISCKYVRTSKCDETYVAKNNHCTTNPRLVVLIIGKNVH